ncbi:hypothetical protein AAMO2058_001221800, partial [Amorphochlora amoebiformis]
RGYVSKTLSLDVKALFPNTTSKSNFGFRKNRAARGKGVGREKKPGHAAGNTLSAYRRRLLTDIHIANTRKSANNPRGKQKAQAKEAKSKAASDGKIDVQIPFIGCKALRSVSSSEHLSSADKSSYRSKGSGDLLSSLARKARVFFDPPSLETAQKDLKASEKDFKTSQKDFKTSQKDFKTSLKDFKTSLKDFKTSPKDFKTSPKDFKTTSEKDFKTSPKDFKTSQKNLKTSQDFKTPQKQHLRISPKNFKNYRNSDKKKTRQTGIPASPPFNNGTSVGQPPEAKNLEFLKKELNISGESVEKYSALPLLMNIPFNSNAIGEIPNINTREIVPVEQTKRKPRPPLLPESLSYRWETLRAKSILFPGSKKTEPAIRKNHSKLRGSNQHFFQRRQQIGHEPFARHGPLVLINHLLRVENLDLKATFPTFENTPVSTTRKEKEMGLITGRRHSPESRSGNLITFRQPTILNMSSAVQDPRSLPLRSPAPLAARPILVNQKAKSKVGHTRDTGFHSVPNVSKGLILRKTGNVIVGTLPNSNKTPDVAHSPEVMDMSGHLTQNPSVVAREATNRQRVLAAAQRDAQLQSSLKIPAYSRPLRPLPAEAAARNASLASMVSVENKIVAEKAEAEARKFYSASEFHKDSGLSTKYDEEDIRARNMSPVREALELVPKTDSDTSSYNEGLLDMSKRSKLSGAQQGKRFAASLLVGAPDGHHDCSYSEEKI